MVDTEIAGPIVLLEGCPHIPHAQVANAGPDPLDVAAIVLDGTDLVMLGLGGAAIAPTRARGLTARARSKGSVLVVTDGHWDGADVRIDSRVLGYGGLGQGHGLITGVCVDVEVSGRGLRPQSTRLDLSPTGDVVGWTHHDPEQPSPQSMPRAL